MPGKKKKVSAPIEKKITQTAKPKSEPVKKTVIPVKKEKDYGNMFELNLNPKLQEIDLKIENKQRIIDSLSSKDWLRVQKATDFYTEKLSILAQELNAQILKIKKEKNDSSMQEKIDRMNQELSEYTKNKEELEKEQTISNEKLTKISQEMLNLKESLDEEYSNLVNTKKTITSEIEYKEMNIQITKDNILQISNQLKMIKELNLHYNQNIEKINEKIESFNKRYYESKITSENASEIKVKILENMAEDLENEKFTIKIQKKFSKMVRFFNEKASEIKIFEDLEEKINNSLLMVDNFQKEESAKELEKLVKSFEDSTEKLNRSLHKAQTSKHLEKIQFLSLENEIKLKEIELASAEKILPLKENQILEIKQQVTDDITLYDEKIGFLQKQVEFYKNQYENLHSKSESMNKDIKKKEEKINKSKSVLEQSEEKIQDSLKKNQILHQNTEELKAKLNELNKNHAKITEGISKIDISVKEKKISNILLQLEVLKHEVLHKDSEIVANLREKQKADEKYEKYKMQLQKLNSKMKNIEGDILKKVNSELDSKDKQIEVLKEMLRGSHGELKVKNVVLSNLKTKLEEGKTK